MKRAVIAGIVRSGLKITKVRHESGLMLILVSKEAGAANIDNPEKK